MYFVRELKTETQVRGFLYKKDGKFYKVTMGIVSQRRQGCVVHECNNLGKGINFSKELHFTSKLDHEAAFQEYVDKTSNQ